MSQHKSLLTAAAVLGMLAGTSALYPNVSFKTSAKPRKRVAIDREKLTAQQREIAEWNDEVERRKAEKKVSK